MKRSFNKDKLAQQAMKEVKAETAPGTEKLKASLRDNLSTIRQKLTDPTQPWADRNLVQTLAQNEQRRVQLKSLAKGAILEMNDALDHSKKALTEIQNELSQLTKTVDNPRYPAKVAHYSEMALEEVNEALEDMEKLGANPAFNMKGLTCNAKDPNAPKNGFNDQAKVVISSAIAVQTRLQKLSEHFESGLLNEQRTNIIAPLKQMYDGLAANNNKILKRHVQINEQVLEARNIANQYKVIAKDLSKADRAYLYSSIMNET